MIARLLVTLCLWMLFTESVLADVNSNCQGAIATAKGDYDFLRTEDLPVIGPTHIGQIHITRLQIFNESDPKENFWLYQIANRFHYLTTEENIRQQILFTEGDTYERRLVKESARLLRQQNHLYDADIRAVNVCDDKVDLEVITRDVWSLNLDASFKRSGGENKFRIGLAETNLFGTGKQISVVSRQDTDRESNVISYRDNNLFGTRIRTRLLFANNDDGSHQFARVTLPFFSLDSRRTWGISLATIDRIDTQYFKGDKVTETDHAIEEFSVFYGFSDGIVKGVSRRWIFGYTYREDFFFEGPDLPEPTTKPRNRELSYPFLQYEAIEDNYVTSFNLDQIHRTEDLHLGHFFRASLGYAATELGSDEDRLVFEGEFSDTLIYSEKTLLQHRFNWQANWNLEQDTSEDVVLEYTIKYFRGQTENRSFFSSFSMVWSENLNSNRQILLGGETGVRGFDKRLQVGDRRMILTLEERQFTNYHLFNLAYLGFAVFIDIGRAWDPGVDDGLDDNILADVGFGVRLASSKANSGRIIHIDFAFPVTNRNDPDVDNFQVVISIKDTL